MTLPLRWPAWISVLDFCIIVALFTGSVGVRVPIAAERKIMPAGDAFNFQHIASQISVWQYPTKEKRLPTYPFFILIGRSVGFDPIQTSIGISILASGGTAVCLYLLGRRLALHRVALLAFLGLSLFDPLLVINGIRPLADSLFVFLTMLLLLLATITLQGSGPRTKSLSEKPLPTAMHEDSAANSESVGDVPTGTSSPDSEFSHEPRAFRPDKASRTGSKLLYSLGVVATLLMFTRYEGFLMAGIIIALLWAKLSWKKVLRVATIPLVASLLWVPIYLHIHGSWNGLPYITDATASHGGFGETSQIIPNLDRMANGAGWKRVWAYPIEVFDEYPPGEAVKMLLTSPNWWVGVFALLGVGWIVVKGRWAGLTIVAVGVGYALLLAWWWVYSRYVAPLSALFYFTAAAGASAAMSMLFLAVRQRRVRLLAPALYLLVAAGFGYILYTEAPILHRRTLSQAWENNHKGYAYYRAMKELLPVTENILFVNDQAVSTLFFGVYGQPINWINRGQGLYLTSLAEKSPADVFEILKDARVGYIVEIPGDERLPQIISLAREHHVLVETTQVKEVLWDSGEEEIVPMYRLRWP